MNALTVTLGSVGAAASILCWASFLSGAWRMIATIRSGQPAPERFGPFIPRLRQMLVEFLAHTRMTKFRTVGWAHWLVMIGFIVGSLLWFEAYGQTFDPRFHWPLFGASLVWLLLDELMGLGTTVGIIVLITIRQLNHPRVPERMSRFGGSQHGAAYFVETVVLLEALGMIGVKAGKIASGIENPPAWTSFFTREVAHVLPDSMVLVSVFALIKLMSGMVWLFVIGRRPTWGVAWHRLSAFFNIYFKREVGQDVALGAARPMMSQGRPIDMETADPDVDIFGAGVINDFSWKGLLDFTTCTECGRCQSQCPAWNTGKPLSPKLLVTSLRDQAYAEAPYLLTESRVTDGSPGSEAPRPLIGDAGSGGVIDPDVLWSCTTCGACVQQCPVDIEHVDHIIDMRRHQVLIESEFPSELAGMFKNLENKGNPWGQNAKDRLNWISELDFHVPVYGRDTDSFDSYEYLFWVGCAGAYEDRAKRTTKAVAELLATAGVKFMVLGQQETCTGDSARRAGNEFLFQQLAQQNIDVLNTLFDGVEDNRKKIVVTCAHCFNTLENEYPQLDGHYEVLHHTQLLNRLVRAKKLIPVASASPDVTYHDPCYLGRHNHVYTEPRELMAVSGAALTEMPRHGERSMCCGAGGARMWMEEKLGKRINIDRVDEALSTSPEKIATGCPFCRIMLSDGVTARQDELKAPVDVVDVSQLMLDSITRLDPAQLSRNLEVPRPEAAAATTPAIETSPPEPIPQQPADQRSSAEHSQPPPRPPSSGGGLAMKGAAKAPGAKTPDAKSSGAATPGDRSSPGRKPPGLAMKGIAKKPGAKAPGKAAHATTPPPSEQPSSDKTETAGGDTTENDSDTATTPSPTAKPAPRPGGLGMKSTANPPGHKRRDTNT